MVFRAGLTVYFFCQKYVIFQYFKIFLMAGVLIWQYTSETVKQKNCSKLVLLTFTLYTGIIMFSPPCLHIPDFSPLLPHFHPPPSKKSSILSKLTSDSDLASGRNSMCRMVFLNIWNVNRYVMYQSTYIQLQASPHTKEPWDKGMIYHSTGMSIFDILNTVLVLIIH